MAFQQVILPIVYKLYAVKPIKQGTKVKNIRINPEGKNEHFIDSKIPGFGAIALKGSVVKKA